MAEVLKTNPSRSGGGNYDILRSERDGVIFCECRGWKMSKATPKTCRHLREYFADPNALPEPAPVPKPTLSGVKPPGLMLAHPAEKAQVSPWGRRDFVAEVKYDGIRLIWMMNGKPRQFARSHLEHSGRYPWLDEMKLPEGTILDGELTTPGEASSYANEAGVAGVLVYVLFDVLQVGDERLTSQPWVVRRQAVELLVEQIGLERVIASRVLGGPPTLEKAEELIAEGAEGVMLKRRDSMYQEGVRSWDWLKHKMTHTVDVVIVDMGALPTAEDRIAAGWKGLRYGYWKDGELTVAGALGVTGPPEELAQHIGKVAEVKSYGLGKTGAIRHPQLLRYRDDKSPEECTFDGEAA